MAYLILSFFGPFQVTLEGAPVTAFESDKVRALLAYLAVEADRPHRRESLAALLWPEQPEARALQNLRQALSRLRRALGETPPQNSKARRDANAFLDVTLKTVQFNRQSHHALDAGVFASLMRACDSHRHRRRETCRSCQARLAQAVALYRGDLLSGFSIGDSLPFEEWLRVQRESLHRRATEALGSLAAHHERYRDFAAAQHYARQLLALEPWDEDAHRLLMRTLALGGQPGAAVAQYEICRRVLAEELSAEPSAETGALLRQIKSGESIKPRAPSPHNLPAPLTPFIGRGPELTEISDRLADPACRLLTLVGPGGVGKTRLALRAARLLLEAYEHGAWFVPLEPVRDPEHVASAIARALGVDEVPARPLVQALKAHLREKELLLVLDNFEQVVSMARLVTELLQAAPQVQALVTSREPLKVYGEHTFAVPPLALPDPGRLPDPEALAEFPAVELFVARARVARPGFSLTPATAPVVVAICARLDGLPLALELAAARLKWLSPEELLERLEQPGGAFNRLALLADGPRDAHARQRTLRAAIGWSYDLLNGDEQRLFRRLAAFVGGFDPEAVEAVCAADDLGVSAMAGLHSLAEKSLLRRADGAPRFGMLETIREYALEQLAANGEADATRVRHAAYFLSLAERAECETRGPRQAEWLVRLDRERHNLRAALGRALKADEAETALRLAGALGDYWRVRGEFAEGRHRLERALAIGKGAPASARAKALRALGHIHERMGAYPQAIERFRSALAVAWDAGDTATVVDALSGLSETMSGRGTAAEARGLGMQALELARERGESRPLALALCRLGEVEIDAGDLETGGRHIEESLELCRTSGDREGIAACLDVLGRIALHRNELPKAARHFDGALSLAREMGDRRGTALALARLGQTAHLQGDDRAAGERLTESLRLARAMGTRELASRALLYLGDVAAAQGDPAAARRHYREGMAEAWAIGALGDVIYALVGTAALKAREGQHEQAGELLGLALSHPSRDGGLTRIAEPVLAALRAALPANQLDAALERGRMRELRRW